MATQAQETLITTPAPLTKKLGAWLYDSLICAAIWIIFILFSSSIAGIIIGEQGFKDNPDILAGNIFYQYAPLLLVAIYIVGTHVRFGQTVGMSAWKIMLVQDNGRPVTFKQALPRAVLSLLGIGMLFSPFNKKRLGWHDMLTHTRVVALPDKEKKKKS
ncbi:RDD family protein [Kangiella sediminilitoris]|uniref:RDD domain containing protein n=1 Tax=Kangiella sediminilitoris TaxID=1144748 RepID=A0A1B3BBV7_9GAMM|nr:RDD family protein [Kangiella sediminilitoris]AOE50275.1 RDD domain containing protein [Kangiella sediminilitoris]